MRRTLGLYWRLISVSMRAQLQYRLSFVVDLLAVGIITFASFATVALILQRFIAIDGWTLGEIAFLYGTVETAFGIMDMVFSGFDPGTFGQLVRKGSFDQILLRPISATLQVLGSDVSLRRLARIFQGAVVLGLSLALVQVQWTLLKALFVPVVIASLVCFYGALFIIGATITFWTVQSIEVVNIFTYGGVEMMSYPMSIYDRMAAPVFYFCYPGYFYELLSRPVYPGQTGPAGHAGFCAAALAGRRHGDAGAGAGFLALWYPPLSEHRDVNREH